jgi:hypothetical protein
MHDVTAARDSKGMDIGIKNQWIKYKLNNKLIIFTVTFGLPEDTRGHLRLGVRAHPSLPYGSTYALVYDDLDI